MKLRILDDILTTVGAIHRLCRIVARQDADLAKQMRRAMNSVGLNAGEGLLPAAIAPPVSRAP